jgi:phosphatidylserine/phosphatidylglycerophosphate/cardiolipin synthase-like enzyme
MSVTTFYRTTFAPYDAPDPASRLLDVVNNEPQRILIDIYGLTYGPLIDALIAAYKRGVRVSIVADHSQAEGTAEKPELQRLVDAGIPVLVGTSSRGAIDHSKYIVGVGQGVVAFGSFNFSLGALSQDNTLTETNDGAMVAVFIANWQRVHDDAFGKHPEWQLSPKP